MAYKSPVYRIISVPVDKIEPNTYNPNSVAPPELRLLYDSIKEDGYTMPVVCYYDKERDKYILVDGFHRYRIMLDYPDIYEREGGMLPVSVIDKPLDHRMASTIRHNRARGSHNVDLMSNIVKELHELGRSDAWISKHLGMDKDEILRLKQITGLAALFRDVEFGMAWQPVEEGESGEAAAAREGENGLQEADVLLEVYDEEAAYAQEESEDEAEEAACGEEETAYGEQEAACGEEETEYEAEETACGKEEPGEAQEEL